MNTQKPSVIPNKPPEFNEEPLHINSFGRNAVRAYQRKVWYELSAGQADDIQESDVYGVMATAAEVTAKSELSRVRQRLGELDEPKKVILDDYARSAPFVLVKGFSRSVKQDKTECWADWLGKEASDGQLTNFLEWHAHRLEEERNDPAVQAELAQQKHDYKVGIKRGIEGGWLDKFAASTVEELDNVKIYAGDIFDTLMQERGGYYFWGAHQIVIAGTEAPDIEPYSIDKINHAAKHEFNHALLVGLEMEATWLNEAVTEHIAQVIDNGEPNVIDPYERKVKKTGYDERRQLLAVLLTEGRQEISPRLLTLAYTEQQREAKGDFTEAVEKAWGVEGSWLSACTLLNKHVEELERKYQEEGYTYMQAQAFAANEACSDLLQQPDIIFASGPVIEYA